ncbi:CaiB/BaiF CoA-transferase family protein [Piscinibacter sp. HJYY11]|uniref:CaiB/BaiF CoA transferase family protein n=1 Tax=Piscinibacter sp. HJYY11 TaxID=2801333 RepID=UPI00191CDE38|nr:CaiB/BaiF CoA-transferase family protein [Piscinibacter sp. HJYY11]MBL0727409.1 CoA transferase [Piscinibacter sp. HJYY11]
MNTLLHGVTVLDFSEYIAGPYCGFLLADLGARVVKIEPPDGAEERRMGGSARRYGGNTRMSLAMNRGKESLSVDLQQPEGREIVYKLVQEADVVLQNFVPGAAEKLGIDYETLAKINKRIVFLSSTAFGEVGPYRKRKGFDIIAHAASGVMSHYADEDGAPRGPGGIAYIDIGTGMLNALGIVSALYHRNVSGEGQKIETSLFSTGMALQAMSLLHIDALDAEQHAEEKHILKTALGEGKKHTQIIDEFAEMRLRRDLPHTTRPIEVPDCLHRPTDRQVYPYYRVYPTGDGYLGIAALNRKLRDRFCTAIGVVDDHVDVDTGDVSDEVYFRQKQMMKTIEARLREHGNAHWMAVLEAAGVPCGPVHYRADLYTDPQAEALGLIWELHNRDLGAYKASGHPIRFSKTPVQPGRGAPSLGEDTEAVLRQAGYGDDDMARLKAAKVVR